MLKDFRILAAIVLLALAGQSRAAQKLAPVILGSFLEVRTAASVSGAG